MKDLDQTISLRLEAGDRIAIQAIASRLFVRESDVYRFAIFCLVNRLSNLIDPTFGGRDLIPVLLDIRNELNQALNLKKHQLENIINSNIVDPNKYVAMSDIEMLLMPQHILKQRLRKISTRQHDDIEEWLKLYLFDKYDLHQNQLEEISDWPTDSPVEVTM